VAAGEKQIALSSVADYSRLLHRAIYLSWTVKGREQRTVLSSIAIVGIVVSEHRVYGDPFPDVDSVSQLQCLKRSDGSSVIVLVCRGVVFDEPEPTSFEGIEQRRREQGAHEFALTCE
jgi:hypothetical protein